MANQLFESDGTVNYASQIVEVHDEMLRKYVDKKGSEIEVAIRAGWVLKSKSLEDFDAGKNGFAIPSYLVQVLMTFVRTKSEVKNSLGDVPILAEDISYGNEDDSLKYMETIMKRIAHAALSCLVTNVNELVISLGNKKQRKGKNRSRHQKCI